MGQYWKLFNLDKDECVEFGGAKLGEFFAENDTDLFINNLLLYGQPDHDFWAGDRIILLGDYSKRLPPNTVTEEDSDLLKICAGRMVLEKPDSEESEEDCHDHVLPFYELNQRYKCIDSVTNTTEILPEDTVYILRSLTKKEYVRSNVIVEYRKYQEDSTPGLAQALFALTGWSEDPSASLSYTENDHVPASGGTKIELHRGAWAGDRINVVVLTDEMQKTLDDEGWTDISEEKSRHVSDVYASDGY